MDIAILKNQLRIDEDERLKPYVDTVGKVTIGVGRNLTDRGISRTEADFLLTNDIAAVQADLNKAIPWWAGLTENRQQVLANMAFNLGINRLMGFKKFLTAVLAGNYMEAGAEMLDSTWANQVGDRAVRLAKLMEQG